MLRTISARTKGVRRSGNWLYRMNLADHPSMLARVALCGFAASLVLDGLAAYSLGPLPLPWIGKFLVLAMAIGLLGVSRLPLYPGATLVVLVVLWGCLATVVGSLRMDYAQLMPPLATSSYLMFVILRLTNLMAFAAMVFLVWWLCANRYRVQVIRVVVLLGSVLATIAIYIYVAQITGLPEPARTRVGTSGEEQATMFTYAFHRAMGTFREPSHLAEWLAAPLLVSFASRRSSVSVEKLLMGIALFLTGSLTGLVGFAIGLAVVVSVGILLGQIRWRTVFGLGVLLLVAGAGFSIIARDYGDGSADLFRVVVDRIGPIIEYGIEASNREYIYSYMGETDLTLVGVGLGNANLMLSEDLGSQATASFLSLYFHTAIATGLVGVTLLILLLFVPVITLFLRRGLRIDDGALWLLGAYVAWLVMFSIHSEELNSLFGTVFALMAYAASAPRIPCVRRDAEDSADKGKS